jgi:hypothetical protein
MKYFIALLAIILIAASLLFFKDNEPGNDAAVTGLPWQINILQDGSTEVFGITLGQTTFGETLELHGDDLQLAIIAAPQETGTLEAYYSRYSAGPITGKLLLILDVAPDVLVSLRERAFQEGGMRRYRLHPDDMPVAYQAPVKVINFLPSFRLDEDVAQSRFGTPAEIIQIGTGEKHLLYPEKGLDLILNTEGKDVLQYLPPQDLHKHRKLLQAQAE